MITRAFNTANLTTIGMAGAGAVAAAIVQSSIPATQSDNVRDLVLAAVAVIGTTMGGSTVRAFAVGFGAAITGSLIRRNILVG